MSCKNYMRKHIMMWSSIYVHSKTIVCYVSENDMRYTMYYIPLYNRNIYICIYIYKLNDSYVSEMERQYKGIIYDCLTRFLFLSFHPAHGSDIFKGLAKCISLLRYK